MSGLRKLAERLKLSTTTVSRALDGYPDVSEKTRARVINAAAEMGYTPNAAARRLRRQRTDLVVMPLPSENGQIGTPHLTAMVAGCAAALQLSGLSLMISPVGSDADELELCRKLVDQRRVDAMILVRTRRDDARVRLLQERGLPFVTDGRTELSPAHAWLDGDGEAGFRAATQRFINDGHRRIAMITGDQSYSFAHLRARGYRLAMREAGLPDDLQVTAPLTEAGGHRAAHALLSRPRPPSAILCTTDVMAIGALSALRETGATAAVVGHDDLSFDDYTHPPLSSMRMQAEDIGQRLAGLLLRCLGGEPPACVNELLPIIAVDRQSHLRPEVRTHLPNS